MLAVNTSTTNTIPNSSTIGHILLLSPTAEGFVVNDSVSAVSYNDGSPIQNFTSFLWQVLPPPVILLGTAGNILSFLVMCRKRLSGSRMSLCLRLLAVVDIIVLWTGYLRYWIWKTFGLDIRAINWIVCKAHSFTVHFSTQFAAWIIVSIAVDRLGVVYFPQFSKRTFTKLKTVAILLVVAFFLLLVNLHFFWSVKPNPDGICSINNDIKWLADFMKYIWPWIDLSMYSIIPAIVLTICNTAIILKVKLSHRKKPLVTRRQRLSRSRINTMSCTLIIISFMFLLTTLPICTFILLNVAKMNQLTSVESMWFAVVNFLSYLNSASNFMLYLISSSFFRTELLNMLCCGKIRAKEQLALHGPVMASSSNAGVRYLGSSPGANLTQGKEALLVADENKGGLQ